MSVDQSWKSLYRVGGVSSLMVGIVWLVGSVFLVFIGPLPSTGEVFFRFVAEKKLLAQATIGVFALADFLVLPSVLALYVALRQVKRTPMLIAAALYGLFVALDIGVNTVNFSQLIPLADKYMVATSDFQRATIITTTDLVRGTTVIGITLASISIYTATFIVGFVLLSGFLGKGVAYLGLASGVVGIIATFAEPGLGVGFLVATIFEAALFLAVGYKLHRLSAGPV